MCKCENCGATFTEGKIINEYRGEYWGAPAYESIEVCPICGDDCIEDINDKYNWLKNFNNMIYEIEKKRR